MQVINMCVCVCVCVYIYMYIYIYIYMLKHILLVRIVGSLRICKRSKTLRKPKIEQKNSENKNQ